MEYTFRARLWLHSGDAGWHFVTLPHDVADEIDDVTAPTGRGFGSVRVAVTIRTTRWTTSLFPDTTSQSFVLPVKRPVRASEGLETGDDVDVTITVLDP